MKHYSNRNKWHSMLVALLLCQPCLTRAQVTIDNVVYEKLSDQEAIASSIVPEFTGTEIVIKNYVEIDGTSLPVTRIVDYGFFRENNKIESLSLPKTFKGKTIVVNHDGIGTEISHRVLSIPSDADYLREIKVDPENKYFSSKNGLLCDATGDTLLFIPPKSVVDGLLTIPAGIRFVPYFAFTSSNNGVYPNDIIFSDSINYVSFQFNQIIGNSLHHVRLKNTIPPVLSGSVYNTALFVPEGSAKAYLDYSYPNGKPYAIIDKANIKEVNSYSYGATAFYDINNNGLMDMVGSKIEFDNNTSKNNGYFECINNGVTTMHDLIGPRNYNGGYLDIRSFELFQSPISDKLFFDTTTPNYYGSKSNNDSPVLAQDDSHQIFSLVDTRKTLYVDIDNDGLKDIVSYGDGLSIFFQQPDGTFVKNTQQLIDDVSAIKNSKTTSSIVEFLGGFLRNSMFVNDEAYPLENIRKTVDFNNDGILDLIDDVAGGILYSCGEGQYFKDMSKQIIYPVDIDNDGIQDYVIFDGSKLYLITNITSETSETKELFTNNQINNVLFKDFDHDGDVDILVYIKSKYTNQEYTSYFVILQNKGDGTFKKKENSITGVDELTIKDCKDLDADGQYEMILESVQSSQSDTKVFKINKDLTVTEIPLALGYLQNPSYAGSLSAYNYGEGMVAGDFDNDGYTEFYTNNGNVYGRFSLNCSQNTAPQKMNKPTAILDTETNRLKITWERGTDAETSACDLTYELRIGSAPGKDDIVKAASLADGRRKTIREGELGTALSTLFNASRLSSGKYYIAIQAIDGGGLGGEFSDELEYEYKISAPKFYVNYKEMTTADTLIAYVKNEIDGATYNWIVPEGAVIDKVDGNSAHIIFNKAGEFSINLSTTINGVTYNSDPQTVSVGALKYSGSEYDNNYCTFLFDFNQNGLIDGYKKNRANNTIIAYQNNGYGPVSQINLSTFAGLNGDVGYVLDYNHDGYPDFTVSGSDKGNVFLNSGEQDYDFEPKTTSIGIIDDYSWRYPKFVGDLNNDGWLDAIIYSAKTDILYSKDNLKKYEENAFGIEEDEAYSHGEELFLDVNRDGFMDQVWQKGRTWYYRLKNHNAEFSYNEPQILFTVPENVGEINGSCVRDFNNDGWPDLAFTAYKYGDSYGEKLSDYGLYFIEGKRNAASSNIVLKINNVYYISGACDVDNNGVIDIPTAEMNVHFKSGLASGFVGEDKTILLKPNWGYEIFHPITGSYDYSEVIPLNDLETLLLNGDNQNIFAHNIKNQAPSTPSQIAAKQTDEGMLITWGDAQDDFTPAMQMRYNVSVKIKGKTGDGAFLISPMNGLKDEAAIVPGYAYKMSTQMLIPASVLTANETYEIQIQAIDLWGAHSAMSQPIELTITDNGYIKAPERTATDKETTVKYVGSQADSYSLQPGENGTIVEDRGNGEYIVKWTTDGVKNLTLTAGNNTISTSITVVKPFDLAFNMPSMILAGVPLEVTMADDMVAAQNNSGLRSDNKDVKIDYASGAKTATILFPSAGDYTIEAYSTDSVRGTTFSKDVQITDVMPEAAIKEVNVEGDNFYSLKWNTSSLPSYINKVIILKEGNSLNQFVVMDTVSVTTGNYIDKSSNASVVSNRYAIKWLADNGQVGNMSEIHKPLHVMIGNAANGGYNLMWNNYEGLPVASYQIWRGASPESMEKLDEIAASQLSYTDINPLTGTSYYAVAFALSSPNLTRSTSSEIWSNSISTDEAVRLVSASSIEITNGTGVVLTAKNPEIQLNAVVLPAYCSISQVAWTIVEGNDLATIDSKGLLHGLIGKGSVKVKATTLDGTNLTAEAVINVKIATRGDLNVDGEVDVKDVVGMINYIMGTPDDDFDVAMADMNEDGAINIGDLIMVLRTVLGMPSVSLSRALIQETLDGTLTASRSNKYIDLDLETSTGYAAFQMEVNVPDGSCIENVELSSDKASTHKILWNLVGNNKYILLGYSMNNSTLSTADNKLLNISLNGGTDGNVEISNIKFVTPSGKMKSLSNVSAGYTTGIRSVTDNSLEDSDVYNVVGVKVSNDKKTLKNLKKGVYIINGKKQVVK